MYRTTGASFERAQQEFATGVMSNKTVQVAAANAATRAAQGTFKEQIWLAARARSSLRPTITPYLWSSSFHLSRLPHLNTRRAPSLLTILMWVRPTSHLDSSYSTFPSNVVHSHHHRLQDPSPTLHSHYYHWTSGFNLIFSVWVCECPTNECLCVSN